MTDRPVDDVQMRTVAQKKIRRNKKNRPDGRIVPLAGWCSLPLLRAVSNNKRHHSYESHKKRSVPLHTVLDTADTLTGLGYLVQL